MESQGWEDCVLEDEAERGSGGWVSPVHPGPRKGRDGLPSQQGRVDADGPVRSLNYRVDVAESVLDVL